MVVDVSPPIKPLDETLFFQLQDKAIVDDVVKLQADIRDAAQWLP